MKFYDEKLEKIVDLEDDEYVGCHYSGQYKPQILFRSLDGDDGEVTIDYNPEIGPGISGRLWNRLDIRFSLGSYYYYNYECENIIRELNPLLKKLWEISSSKYDRPGINWDEKLVKEIRKKLDEIGFSDLVIYDEDDEYEDEDD